MLTMKLTKLSTRQGCGVMDFATSINTFQLPSQAKTGAIRRVPIDPIKQLIAKQSSPNSFSAHPWHNELARNWKTAG